MRSISTTGATSSPGYRTSGSPSCATRRPSTGTSEAVAPRGGFWAVTRYDDCVTVNRDWEHFSSARRISLFGEMEDDQLAQQQLMMLNMDPTMHTRYRRLVNKGFTPKMVRDLEAHIVGYADGIIDSVCERGTADFVEEISAELPLLVIAELLGRPPGGPAHGVRLVEPHDRLGGPRVPDPRQPIPVRRPCRCSATPRSWPTTASWPPRTTSSRSSSAPRSRVRSSNELELDLFFMLLIVAGNETTRNLMSGAMAAFFDHPEQWQKLPRRPFAPALGRRGDVALRDPGHALPAHGRQRPRAQRPGDPGGRQGGVLAHLGQPRRDVPSTSPTRSTSRARPTTTLRSAVAARTSAWGRTWPAWRSW